MVALCAIALGSCADEQCCMGYQRIDAWTWSEGYEFCESDEDWDNKRYTFECDTDMNGVNMKCECE
jgi:hypothetical protein